MFTEVRVGLSAKCLLVFCLILMTVGLMTDFYGSCPRCVYF